MSEKPILFSTEMVQKVMTCAKCGYISSDYPCLRCGSTEFLKSQTRRVIKTRSKDAYFFEVVTRQLDNAFVGVYEMDEHGDFLKDNPLTSPYQVGDMAYVRETWCPVNDTEFGGEFWIDYRATPKYEASHPAGWDNAPDDPDALKWRPSIHMPKKYARIWLEVTGVRVERLQDISVDDCKSEGIKYCDLGNAVQEGYVPQKAFADLWDSINPKYPWASNPYVWVYDFKRIK